MAKIEPLRERFHQIGDLERSMAPNPFVARCVQVLANAPVCSAGDAAAPDLSPGSRLWAACRSEWPYAPIRPRLICVEPEDE